jgi:hypothetical protein
MPYFKISRPPDHAQKNTGSVKDLAEYLEKENLGKDMMEKEYFFDHNNDNVLLEEVIHGIDNNKKGLKKTETKFYEMSMSFSQRELNHISTLHPKQGAKDGAIKEYIRSTMDEYAKQFDRGLEGKDIVYYAKIERNRRYHPKDAANKDTYKVNYAITAEINALPESDHAKRRQLESKFIRDSNGTVIYPGNIKAGDNTHVHIIVSRRDKGQSISLSPLANSRGGLNKLNGKEVKIGFDRDNFVQKIETKFDKQFAYERNRVERYRELRMAKSIHGKVNEIVHAFDDPERFAQKFATKLVKKTINKEISKYLREHGYGNIVLPLQQMISSNRANLVNLAAKHLGNDLLTKGMVQGLASNIPTPVGVIIKSITIAYSLLSNPRTKGHTKGMGLER